MHASKKWIVVLGLACCWVGARAWMVRADTVGYQVSIDTSSLQSTPGLSYELFLQFNDGGTTSNSVTFDSFNFGGGSSGGFVDPNLTMGGVSGSFEAGSVILAVDPVNNPSSWFDETFTPGSTLSFEASTTDNSGGVTPDELAVQVLELDNSGNYNYALNTLDPQGNNSLVTLSYSGPTPMGQAYASTDGSFAPPTLTPQFTVAPLPSSAALAGMLLAGVGMECYRQKRRQKAAE